MRGGRAIISAGSGGSGGLWWARLVISTCVAAPCLSSAYRNFSHAAAALATSGRPSEVYDAGVSDSAVKSAAPSGPSASCSG